MKFKVGDKVRVKNNLLSDNTYDGLYFNSMMVYLRGKEFVINTIGQFGYHFKDHAWAFNDAMVDLIDNSKSSRPSQSDLKRGYWTASHIVTPRAIWDGDIKDTPVPTPTTGAVKHDQGKPDMTMIPFCALEEVAKALGHGKKKYGRNNYQSGINTTRLAASALRHIGSWCDGVDLDSESDENHIAHAAANLLMLLWTIKNKPEMDDR